MQALDHYINEIKTLPPAPRVLSQLLVLLNEEEAHASQIVELIMYDPALTAKVLQRCNNAATGLGRNEIRIVETPLTETPKALTIAPISINIYEFAKQ